LEEDDAMRRIVQVWIVALLCVGWVSAQGWATTETPTALIQQTTTQVLGILKDPSLQGAAKRQEREARLQAIGDQVFDWPAMAQSALAFHWRSLTPQQRQEFIPLFKGVVEHAYMDRLAQAAQREQAIRYTGEQEGPSQAVVSTRVTTQSDQEIPIVYYLHEQQGRWLIYDVIVEGVGLVSNYQAQINDILDNASYDQLIQRMKAKLAEETSASAERP
jgi:phospholipid transport system substrate-binding protein